MLDLTSLTPYGVRDDDLLQWRFPCPLCGVDEWYPAVVMDEGRVFCEACKAQKNALLQAWNIPVSNGDRPPSFLEKYRVDLIQLRRDGIPPREYIPGCYKMLVKGGRHHLAAPMKTGKSLTIAVKTAVDIVRAGGVVTILDRENGESEYARRLDDVLTAIDADYELEELLARNYQYYAFPQLSLAICESKDYVRAFAGDDLVIFDATRRFLTNLNLNEDSSDDYGRFEDRIVEPLYRAGIATLLLDNTGKDGKDARGSSTKGDLPDVVFTMAEVEAFNKDETGKVQLEVTHSRIGEVYGSWTMTIGGGVFGNWIRENSVPDIPPDNESLMEKVSRALEAEEGLSSGKVRKAVGSNYAGVDAALAALVRRQYVRRDVIPNGRGNATHKHYVVQPFRVKAESETLAWGL